MINNKSIYQWLSVGIVGFAFAIRLFGLNKGIWFDEYDSMRVAFINSHFNVLRHYDHPPLYFILLKLWSLISVKEEFLRLLSVLFGTGTVYVIMKWVKQYSRLGSLLSGLYCATLPIMLRYSQEIRDYPLFLLLTALSFLFASYIIAETNRLSNYLALALSLSLAIATHLIGVMLLMSITLYIALSVPNLSKVRFKEFILAMVIPLIVFIFLYFLFLQGVKQNPNTWWMPHVNFRLILDVTKEVFVNWRFLAGMHKPFPILPISTVMIIIFGFILILGSWKRSLPLFAAALIYWFQLIIYSIFFLPIFIDRIVLPGVIPFIGFLGLQIAAIKMKKIRAIFVTILVALCTLFSLFWIKGEHKIPCERWKEIYQTLKVNWRPGDIIMIYSEHIEGIVQYYAHLTFGTYFIILKSDGMDKFINKVSGRTINVTDKHEHPTVFLIARTDRGNYRKLLARLKSGFGQPTVFKNFGNLSLIKY
ncbi:MAG: glycosyltransferase family 39 protein [Candidatus Omnitrophota bacterium]